MKTKLLIISIVLFSVSVFAQNETNLIKVQGKAILKDTPELMVVNISLSSKDSIYSICSDKLISNYNELEEAFISSGLSKKQLKADGLNIDESYSWSGRERKQDGFKGNISIIIELPYNAKSLTNVMNTLKGNKFPVSYRLSFKLSKKQKDELLRRSIELAIEDAKFKAEIIAKSFGVKLDKIQDVNFGYTSYQNDQLTSETDVFFCIADEEEEEQVLNLNPQKIEIRKTLGVIWKIKE